MSAPLVLLPEASAATGLGHFVRTCSLGDHAAARGRPVEVVLRPDALPWAHAQVRERGWPVRVCEWSSRGLLGRGGARAHVCVDSYRVDGPWLTQLAGQAGALLVVDDLADRRFTADVLLNQNLSARASSYLDVRPVRLILGPRYALLRPGFARVRARLVDERGRVAIAPDVPGRVLVVMGGTDAAGITATVTAGVVQALPAAAVRAVVSSPEARTAVESIALPGPGRLQVVDRNPRVDWLMARADLVVTAGGTTLWELCCLGRAIAAVVVADNQRAGVRALVEQGAALDLGEAGTVSAASVAAALRPLLDDPGLTARLANRAVGLTDGRGCERVLDVLDDLDA